MTVTNGYAEALHRKKSDQISFAAPTVAMPDALPAER